MREKRKRDKDAPLLEWAIEPSRYVTDVQVSSEISEIEKEIASLDDLMLDPKAYQEALNTRDVFKEYQAKQQTLDAKMANWEEAVNKHEELSNQ